jgi:hypothetical protein
MYIYIKKMSRDSSVGNATGYELDGRGYIPGKVGFFLQRPHRLWIQLRLLSNGYQGPSPQFNVAGA